VTATKTQDHPALALPVAAFWPFWQQKLSHWSVWLCQEVFLLLLK